MKLKRLWLGLPFAVVFLVDAGITLAGQPKEFWAGDYRFANEGFPIFAWGLSHGPGGFIGVSLGWMVVFSGLILTTPRLVAAILSLALVNGHTWGAMTWLVYQFNANYYVCLLYFLFTAALYLLCYRQWQSGEAAPAGA